MDKTAAKASLNAYYDNVAPHYDARSAEFCEEQRDDLDEAQEQLATLLAGHRVLELGCGTGAWTEVLAETAQEVVAIDASSAMLEQAQLHAQADNVTYRLADALNLPEDIGQFTAVFAAGLWAELERDAQDALLAHLKKRVGRDVLLVLFDDAYVEGESPTIARTDLVGNTWQFALDADGVRHEVPKNYPTDSALRKRVGNFAREIKIARWEFYWVLTARLK